jgi:predicted phosphodiesterase
MTINLHQPYQDRESFIHELDSTIHVLQSERWIGRISGGKITRGLTELKIPENLVVLGDLHGDLQSLKQVLHDIDFKNFLSNTNNKIVFLGDYVDRGSGSIEVLQYVCQLKYRYPDSVILMRGNHEAPTEFPFSSHDLPIKIRERFGQDWNLVYSKILEMFQLFTLVTVIGSKLSLIHGGPPVLQGDNYKELVSDAPQTYRHDSTLEEILWNDPRSLEDGVLYEPSRRSFGKHFGSEISRKWLEMSGTCAIVRSHEPCHRFRIDHGNMVMTVFSCKEAYPRFEPGYLFLTGKQLEKIQDASDLVQYIRKIKGR